MRWISLIANHACFFVSSTPFMLLMSGSEVFLFNISSIGGMCFLNSCTIIIYCLIACYIKLYFHDFGHHVLFFVVTLCLEST